MQTELDKVKSTITISLGTKNRLRKLKGSHSYEDYINYLLRLNNKTEPIVGNQIEIQRFERKTGVYGLKNFKIIFTYNGYNHSRNFFFDICVNKTRKDGKIISFKKYLKALAEQTGKKESEIKLRNYFELLQVAIRKEIEPMFKHKGRIEDYYRWEKEFETLHLPKKSFEEDVLQKLATNAAE